MIYLNEVKNSIINRINDYDKVVVLNGIIETAIFDIDKYLFKTSNTHIIRYLLSNYSDILLLKDYSVINTRKVYSLEINKNLLKNKFEPLSYIVGVFLSIGVIVDPKKSYNLEFVFRDNNNLKKVKKILLDEGFNFLNYKRKNRFVLYTKNSQIISEFLYFIGLIKYANDIDNIKIIRDIKKEINANMNLEISNQQRVYEVSKKQLDMIYEIQSKIGLSNIDEDLSYLCKLRIENEDLSMRELAELYEPKVSKSTISRRFNNIKKIYEGLK